MRVEVWKDPRGGWWAAEDLGEGWVASYRFVVQEGSPVLAEINVRPSSEIRPSQAMLAFLGEALPEAGDIPRGGLSGRRIRRMTPATLLADLLIGWERDIRNEVERAIGRGDDPIQITVPDGGWEELAWRWMHTLAPIPESGFDRALIVAVLYADGMAKGERSINKYIAERLARSPSQVRDDVYAARRAGLLTGSHGRGKPGGALTDKALKLIEEARLK